MSRFTIDWQNRRATCPQGKTSVCSVRTKTQRDNPQYQFFVSGQDKWRQLEVRYSNDAGYFAAKEKHKDLIRKLIAMLELNS
ncbi:MAG: hypothetical protein GY805_03185 [Chloroflexi bacterium]|nr:hypothetical protein [Chloroflexota bacterium]